MVSLYLAVWVGIIVIPRAFVGHYISADNPASRGRVQTDSYGEAWVQQQGYSVIKKARRANT